MLQQSDGFQTNVGNLEVEEKNSISKVSSSMSDASENGDSSNSSGSCSKTLKAILVKNTEGYLAEMQKLLQ